MDLFDAIVDHIKTWTLRSFYNSTPRCACRRASIALVLGSAAQQHSAEDYAPTHLSTNDIVPRWDTASVSKPSSTPGHSARVPTWR